ncbi:hypothetical protein YpB42003004_1967 [Yersinia pestis biovar Antiqua str. B42003004]|nr:hypothetical protein YpE1979001_1817 [Yersinia pestis biovar Antiqua str. E1979001]EDR52153.1 hypothetical protein YpB42003004_1967 [Yersinia pestis biovar Antiqua str. B42003004]EDR63758.1 hypothetical protein YpK1973002_3162 [Yersinia pestis biovar Mediaevalis str. K1973002]EIR92490.1 hypothetical protein YPPY42_1946 [Yersinia pestis PY-42]EIS28504.1 hypothetical protein YPPY54_1971 [Yersinia pestis PY-54]EIS30307.1 hypothetical protein YPPY55_1900 [Yersinia pestis PY-55]EIS57722.1 hypot
MITLLEWNNEKVFISGAGRTGADGLRSSGFCHADASSDH